MADETIPPALTPEEWRRLLAGEYVAGDVEHDGLALQPARVLAGGVRLPPMLVFNAEYEVIADSAPRVIAALFALLPDGHPMKLARRHLEALYDRGTPFGDNAALDELQRILEALLPPAP